MSPSPKKVSLSLDRRTAEYDYIDPQILFCIYRASGSHRIASDDQCTKRLSTRCSPDPQTWTEAHKLCYRTVKRDSLAVEKWLPAPAVAKMRLWGLALSGISPCLSMAALIIGQTAAESGWDGWQVAVTVLAGLGGRACPQPPGPLPALASRME